MKRAVALLAVCVACVTAACGGSKSASSSGSTTTTNPDAYLTAYTVCLQFNNTDKMRNAEPAQITDDGADEVFVGLALQLKPAMQKDPRAWSKLNTAATKLRRELMADTISDSKVESAITAMADACQAAKKAPAKLSKGPTAEFTPTPPTTTGSTTSTTAGA